MSSVYMVILNIPPNFHSSDLRSFFSDFTECQGHFSCFHFRHRPQKELLNSLELPSLTGKGLLVTKDAVCCIVKCCSKEAQSETIKKYHLQNWVDKTDRFFSSCCVIVAITVVEDPVELPITSFCFSDARVEFKLSRNKIEEMFELKPPLMMPKGNIGTPTKHFLELIKACRLPSNLIGKLGLYFPKTKSRRYGSVPFNYGPTIPSCENRRNTGGVFFTTSSSKEDKKCEEKSQVGDDEEEQEWDRHDALHDDVTEQERNKERLYEEEMEVVWEKGGPGIVWYTDAQRWKEAEGDFDEQTTDDWDVDYSVYFEENGGDKDARDLIEMRRSTMWRQGNEESVFKKPSGNLQSQRVPRNLVRSSSKLDIVGPFEQHTRGIGRRLMEKQGWRDGIGLGRSQKGIAKPIESEGQKPKERKGLGYFGERIPRFIGTSHTNKGTRAFIATIYDRPSETDPPEPLLRRNQPTTMKYRYM